MNDKVFSQHSVGAATLETRRLNKLVFLLLSGTPALFTARLLVLADSMTFGSALLEPFTPQRDVTC